MADGAAPITEKEQKPFERNRDAPLIERLWLASGEIDKLEKDGHVQIGREGYDYITHDLVTLEAKKAFQKHGVMMLPTIANHQKDGNRTELTVAVSFINVDRPEDTLTIESIGYGVDPSDKGPGKAFSYAMKYALLKVLMLNSADDIEAANIEHEPAGPTWRIAEETRQGAEQALQAWAENLRVALTKASTTEEILDLEKANKKTLMAETTPEVTRNYFIDLIQQRKADIKKEPEK